MRERWYLLVVVDVGERCDLTVLVRSEHFAEGAGRRLTPAAVNVDPFLWMFWTEDGRRAGTRPAQGHNNNNTTTTTITRTHTDNLLKGTTTTTKNIPNQDWTRVFLRKYFFWSIFLGVFLLEYFFWSIFLWSISFGVFFWGVIFWEYFFWSIFLGVFL
ncbi:hypothetical protein NL108_017395 [Boleophthalmus pectinirostris]|nr:hypothetical protein NL108_017395 [Boleophthalmus pectinirostris]